jgi:hypothetical protein
VPTRFWRLGAKQETVVHVADWSGILSVTLEECPLARLINEEYSSPGRRIFFKKPLGGGPPVRPFVFLKCLTLFI